MKISSQEELERWNFDWVNVHLGPWRLEETKVEEALHHSKSAIGIYCMGYCPTGKHEDFDLKYVGKAVDQSIYDRLHQHLSGSHNFHIRQHLGARPGTYPLVWFRYVGFSEKALAEQCEGVVISALLWNGPKTWTGWNRRNEWSKQTV